MIWTLSWFCAAVSLVDAGLIRQTSRAEKKAAPQEELNLLIFGVVQFTDSLNYIYQSTEAKIRQIQQALQSHEEALQTLGAKTEDAAEVKKQIKEAIELLQSQMAEHQADIRLTWDLLSSTEKEEVKLSTKVKKLESDLNNSLSITKLQERAEKHSNVLRTLQRLTQDQRRAIKCQNKQISKLQKMINGRI